MSVNLIDKLRKSFTEKSYQDISEYVGINTQSAKNGINALVPAVLACILGNNTLTSATQPIWWNALKEEYPYTDNEYINTSNLDKPSFLIKGREVLSGMFRTNHDELVKSISSVAGIQKEKAAGLIEVGVPLIIGYLNNWVKTKGWKFKDLIANLIDSKPTIVKELPIGISATHFGINGVKDVTNVIDKTTKDFSETIKTEIPTNPKAVKRNKNSLMWIIGLIVIALLAWYFLANRACVRNIEDEVIVPEIDGSITEVSFHVESMDGTFYANQTEHDYIIK